MVKEDLRIGVFVCDCGSNIAGFVDTEEVRTFAEGLPDVADDDDDDVQLVASV